MNDCKSEKNLNNFIFCGSGHSTCSAIVGQAGDVLPSNAVLLLIIFSLVVVAIAVAYDVKVKKSRQASRLGHVAAVDGFYSGRNDLAAETHVHRCLVLPQRAVRLRKSAADERKSMTKRMMKSMYDAVGRARSATTGIPPKPKELQWEIDAAAVPADCTPLVCFVNTGSGGQQGLYVLAQLRRFLLPEQQVFDLAHIKPDEVLAQYAVLPAFKVLCCGGDGTIGWVLNALQFLEISRDKASVALLPLGTGNDLALQLGWVHCLECHSIGSFLENVLYAQKVPIDRWQITVEEGVEFDPAQHYDRHRRQSADAPIDDSSASDAKQEAADQSEEAQKSHIKASEKKAPSKVTKLFQNYLGFGVDAQIVYQFHEMRKAHSFLFIHRWINNMVYGFMGWSEIWNRSFDNFPRYVRVFCEGEELVLPPDTEGIVFLNIASYGGGACLWQNDTDVSSAASIETAMKATATTINAGEGRQKSNSGSKEHLTRSTARRKVARCASYSTAAVFRAAAKGVMDFLYEDSEDDSTSPASLHANDQKEEVAGEGWAKASQNDGLLELVAVRSSFQLATVKFLGLNNVHKLAQGSSFEIYIVPPTEKLPVQSDGEPWLQKLCRMRITAAPQGQAMLLKPCPAEVDKGVIRVLDWAQQRGIISTHQEMLIVQEYTRRIENDSI